MDNIDKKVKVTTSFEQQSSSELVGDMSHAIA
jgi:hypothetical protein